MKNALNSGGKAVYPQISNRGVDKKMPIEGKCIKILFGLSLTD